MTSKNYLITLKDEKASRNEASTKERDNKKQKQLVNKIKKDLRQNIQNEIKPLTIHK
jgi:hypothetical protein